MFSERFAPRFYETDSLGHVNNTVFPAWFEHARGPLCRWFTPDLDVKKWRLIIAKISCEFKHECFYGKDVTVKTAIKSIGNSSFVVTQACYQLDTLVACGETVMVHFDHQKKQSLPVPEDIKRIMSDYLLEGEWPTSLSDTD